MQDRWITDWTPSTRWPHYKRANVLASIGDVDSAAPSFALWELSRLVRRSPALTAEFDAGFDELLVRIRSLAGGGDADAAEFLGQGTAFLHEFGSRGHNKWEIHSETWETDPALALAALDRVRFQADAESPTRRYEANAALRRSVSDSVRAKLAADGEASGLPCAISVPDATLRIPDGAMVEVNGTTGTVTMVER